MGDQRTTAAPASDASASIVGTGSQKTVQGCNQNQRTCPMNTSGAAALCTGTQLSSNPPATTSLKEDYIFVCVDIVRNRRTVFDDISLPPETSRCDGKFFRQVAKSYCELRGKARLWSFQTVCSFRFVRVSCTTKFGWSPRLALLTAE